MNLRHKVVTGIGTFFFAGLNLFNCITAPTIKEESQITPPPIKETPSRHFYQNYGYLLGEAYLDQNTKIHYYDTNGDKNIDKGVMYTFKGFAENGMVIWEAIQEWDDLNDNGEVDENELTKLHILEYP